MGKPAEAFCFSPQRASASQNVKSRLLPTVAVPVWNARGRHFRRKIDVFRDTLEVRALDAIVQRCLAKDPRDRYGSASELATDLVPALARLEGLRAPLAGPGQTALNGSAFTATRASEPPST